MVITPLQDLVAGNRLESLYSVDGSGGSRASLHLHLKRVVCPVGVVVVSGTVSDSDFLILQKPVLVRKQTRGALTS